MTERLGAAGKPTMERITASTHTTCNTWRDGRMESVVCPWAVRVELDEADVRPSQRIQNWLKKRSNWSSFQRRSIDPS